MPSAMQLNPRFRWSLYAAFAVLFVTGVAWLFADRLKDSANGETWQAVSAALLTIHGGITMVTLLLLGALYPAHILRGWRRQKNRLTGTFMIAFNLFLIATAFGLYYAGSEVLRPWISDVHTAVGLFLPPVILVHVIVGRKSRRIQRDRWVDQDRSRR